jgi:hypothetical protein
MVIREWIELKWLSRGLNDGLCENCNESSVTEECLPWSDMRRSKPRQAKLRSESRQRYSARVCRVRLSPWVPSLYVLYIVCRKTWIVALDFPFYSLLRFPEGNAFLDQLSTYNFENDRTPLSELSMWVLVALGNDALLNGGSKCVIIIIVNYTVSRILRQQLSSHIMLKDNKNVTKLSNIFYTVRLTPWFESVSELYRPSDCRLSAKLVQTFADRRFDVISVTDTYGRILGFLDWICYFSFQVVPQLYSRDWVDPVPDPLVLRISGSTGNRTRTSGSVATNSDH